MIYLGGIYLAVSGLVLIAAATDRTFTRSQAVGLALSWPVWLPRVFTGGA